MLEKIIGLKKLSILQCQALAKKIGFDSTEFKLCGPTGEIECKWLDAHLGIFKKKDDQDCMLVSQFQFINDIYCKDVMPIKNDER